MQTYFIDAPLPQLRRIVIKLHAKNLVVAPTLQRQFIEHSDLAYWIGDVKYPVNRAPPCAVTVACVVRIPCTRVSEARS